MEPVASLAIICVAKIRCLTCGTEWKEIITSGSKGTKPECSHGCSGGYFQILDWHYEYVDREM